MPLEFIPVLASSPASTTVTKSGPSSWCTSSTTQVSAACSSQSQFCPINVWPSALRSGVTANAEHSPTRRVSLATCRAFAANMTSVRTLIASTSTSSSPAPSAMPRISSR